MAEAVDNHHQHTHELSQPGNKEENKLSNDNPVGNDQHREDHQKDEKQQTQKNTDNNEVTHGDNSNNNPGLVSVDPQMNHESTQEGVQKNEQVMNDQGVKQDSVSQNNIVSQNGNVKTQQDDRELSPEMKRSSLKGSSQSLSAHNQGEFSNQGSLGRILGESRRSRKQAELEAAVLAGRLGLLRQEELNSRRKIFQTKKQTYEYFILKQTNEMNQSQKRQNNQDEEQNLQRRREENERHRTSKRNDRDLARNTILEANKTSYITIKKDQEINEQRKRDIEESKLRENQKRKELVQQQKLRATMHVAKFKNKQAEMFMQNYNQWIEEEEHIKQIKKQQVQQMEQLELNMIKKLQATQILQRKAFEELQGIIQMPSEKFNETYHPIFKKKNVSKLILSATNAALNQQQGQQKNEGSQDNKNQDNNAQIIHIEGNEEETGGVNRPTNNTKNENTIASPDPANPGIQPQEHYSLTERVRDTQSSQGNELQDDGKMSYLTDRGQNNIEKGDNMLRQSALSDRQVVTKGSVNSGRKENNNNNKKVKKTRKKLPSGVTLSSSKAFFNQPGVLKDIYLPSKNRN